MAIKTRKTGQTRAQKRAQKTRKRLKKAALDVFSQKAIDATTVEDITEKADLGKGTLYQHFEDKDEIVITLVEEAIGHLIECIRSYDSQPENLEDMLEHLLNAHYVFSANSRGEFLLLFQGRLLVKLQNYTLEDMEGPYLRYLREIEEQLAPFLPAGVPSQKVRRLACAVAGFVFGFLSFAMIGMTDEQMHESIKPLRKVFVKGLCTFVDR